MKSVGSYMATCHDICDKGDDGLTCFVSDSHKVMVGPIVKLLTKLLFAIS